MAENESTTTEEKLILVGTKYSALSQTWSQHDDTTVEAVIEKITGRVLDGKANGRGMEVLEVTVTRRVRVAPVIQTVEVMDSTKEPTS